MPNIKSAKKRVKVIEKKTLRNRAERSALKTALKKFEVASNAGDVEKTKDLYNATISKIDVSCSKGIIHKNKANRTKAQISKKLNVVLSGE